MANKPLTLISDIAQIRFWAKVHKGLPNECWPWLGAKTDKGYGYCFPYGAKGRQYRAHRIAIFLAIGVDPGEHGSMHSCDNRPCCNPAHLDIGSQTDNLADMRAKNRDYKFPVIFGERAPHAILTDNEVAEIRSLRIQNPKLWTERALAARFKIANSQIHLILHNKSRPIIKNQDPPLSGP